MSDVKRYSNDYGDMTPNEYGDWVRFSDFDREVVSKQEEIAVRDALIRDLERRLNEITERHTS